VTSVCLFRKGYGWVGSMISPFCRMPGWVESDMHMRRSYFNTKNMALRFSIQNIGHSTTISVRNCQNGIQIAHRCRLWCRDLPGMTRKNWTQKFVLLCQTQAPLVAITYQASADGSTMWDPMVLSCALNLPTIDRNIAPRKLMALSLASLLFMISQEQDANRPKSYHICSV
jgi:hypothetical protein